VLGDQPELAYNIALCYYRQKQFGPALKHVAEIIEKGVRDHPELSVGRWGFHEPQFDDWKEDLFDQVRSFSPQESS
jgi:hypothetical protein